MPNYTQEQRDADEALSNAIRNHLKAFGRETHEDLILSYTCVVETGQMDVNLGFCRESHTIITNLDCRLSVAMGNLIIGRDIVVADSDDDEPGD